jgi:hypothetical protein
MGSFRSVSPPADAALVSVFPSSAALCATAVDRLMEQHRTRMWWCHPAPLTRHGRWAVSWSTGHQWPARSPIPWGPSQQPCDVTAYLPGHVAWLLALLGGKKKSSIPTTATQHAAADKFQASQSPSATSLLSCPTGRPGMIPRGNWDSDAAASGLYVTPSLLLLSPESELCVCYSSGSDRAKKEEEEAK